LQIDPPSSGGSVTIANSLAVSGSGISSNGAIESVQGTNTISGNVILTAWNTGTQGQTAGTTGNTTIGVDAGTLTIAGTFTHAYVDTTGTIGSTLTKTGAGTLIVNRFSDTVAANGSSIGPTSAQAALGGLVISQGYAAVAPSGTVSLADGSFANLPQATSYVDSLTIGTGATLDLNNNSMLIEYGSGTSPVGDLSFARTARNYPAGSIQRYAQTAFDGFAWDGPGLTSSVAANDPNGLTAIGIADENDLGDVYPGDNTVADGGTGTWQGIPVNDTNNVLVRLTYYGDGNDDGVVNRLDVTALSQGFSGLAGYVGWSDGDYTYAGDIAKVDVSLLAQSYLFQGAPLGNAITSGQAQYLLALDPDMSAAAKADFQSIAGTPEPASISLLGAAGLLTLTRRRRGSWRRN
jgi:hypothetical protein